MFHCVYVYMCVCVYTCISHIFIHSSVNGHLSCFLVLTTENSVAVNTGVHIFKLQLFLDICLGVGLQDCTVNF